MLSKRVIVSLAAATVAAGTIGGSALAASVAGGEAGGRLLSATLLGANEVPGPGDPDGSGAARVTSNSGEGVICYEISVSGIAPATMAHIHEGDAGTAGPVVVGLAPPSDGSSDDCTTVDPELAKEIRKDPSGYYVNVHNPEYPVGALRGQLSR